MWNLILFFKWTVNGLCFLLLLYLFTYLLIYCCLSTVVSIFSPWLPPTPTSLPTTLDPLWLCTCVLYTYSLMNFPLFPPVILSHLLSGYWQFVLNFNGCGYIWLICLLIRFHLKLRSYLSLTCYIQWNYSLPDCYMYFKYLQCLLRYQSFIIWSNRIYLYFALLQVFFVLFN